ncbi:MAG TPA: ATP-dependent DNA helicase RecG, partial [Chitinophagaceae bacterium]|nr:ATP-dependent DNA helicase RecG [Chitinophagaceae bacterium]
WHYRSVCSLRISLHLQTIAAGITSLSSILSNPIEYLKGVGPVRGDMLRKELQIFCFGDLLEHFPYRHVDKTEVKLIRDISYNTDFIQVAGKLTAFHITGSGRGRRLVGELQDKSGVLELTWFQGVNWISKSLEVGKEYLVFGKPGFFLGKPQITHPEIELFTADKAGGKSFLEPIYPTTEKLKTRGLNGRNIGKLVFNLFSVITSKEIPENLPENIISQYNLMGRWDAYRSIHFPAAKEDQQRAVYRLKFEEFFLAQLRLGMIRSNRHRYSKGIVFSTVGDHFNTFYEKYLPFQLTGAQKRVLKEIRQDTARGRQMNRLLQGDVGSGKTIVALMSMLIAADNGYQSCMMAPTEILAQQHYAGISELLKDMTLNVRLLTGSVKASARKKILAEVAANEVQILIGTHALIEKDVQFSRLGMAIVDEQHRFGVAQRAKLWEKSEIPPHVLVMTATPIPRTLAMTAYGDLDYSVMDELPPGRQPIKTVHRYEHSRHQVMDFIRLELKKGRQAYIIFPLIEESEKLNYENLMKGYENVKAYFPEPQTYISMVHGKMNGEQKDTNMKRFVENDTQIMVSTTVIEVGVNVPNASVMVIESAEKFGLSQLHQLRGRVGRGAEKSYCILLTGDNISKEARERLAVMCSTNNGFVIAEKDLEIRGPGDIEGTRQSGLMNFKLANIVEDRELLELAKQSSSALLQDDPDLASDRNLILKHFLAIQQGKTAWSKIS